MINKNQEWSKDESVQYFEDIACGLGILETSHIAGQISEDFEDYLTWLNEEKA